MKPLPLLLAAAGLAVAASGGYFLLGSGSTTGATRAGGTGGSAALDASSDSPANSGPSYAPMGSAAAPSRIGRSFRAGQGGDEASSAGAMVAANGSAPSEATGGGISTEHLRTPHPRTTAEGGLFAARNQENHALAQNRNEPSAAGKSVVAFGALADPAPEAGAGEPTGLLPHPDIPKPAAPKLAGKPMAPAPAPDAASGTAPTTADNTGAEAARAEVPVYVSRQRGGSPPWPTGPFTPDQELYRAQVGSANFDAWLNAEAKKQRSDLQ